MILFYLLLFLIPSISTAQANIRIGGLGGDEAVATAIYQNKIIVGGTFQQMLNGQPSHGGSDIFLQAYNLQGQLSWQYNLGSSNNEQLKALCLSPSGAIYSTGMFSDSLFIGATDSILYNHQQAVFIVKQDIQGQFLWSRSLSGQSLVVVEDIVSDAQENIYITGAFQDTFVIDSNHQLIGGAKNSPFLIKLDPDGKVLWSQSPALSDEATGIALTIDDKGQLYWAGHFKGSFALLSDTIRAHWVYNDLFLSQVDSNGHFIWQRHYGGVYNNTCKQLEWYAGSLYLGGSFMGVLDIPPLRLVTAFRNFDAFVVQLNMDGIAKWGIQSQTEADCFFEAIAFYQDQIVVSGVYNDYFKWQQQQVPAINGAETFQVVLDSNGQGAQINTWTGNGFDLVKSTAIHSSGQVVAVGGFQQDIRLGKQTLQAQGFSDAFLYIQDSALATSVTKIAHFELVKLSFAPNPSQDSTTILCPNGRVKKWLLYNMQGQLVAQGNQATVPLQSISSGTYSIQVHTDKGMGIEKLIVH
ncbi:T9SS type A sorting domain-containing protein [Aureispira anguillae]|uniref:T9SS type A sorting domain-containing protein n=1 Tax=Aureispira anguillae TaxID=2864201 RepID=A0A916DV78_9BACT|nr:T9SS type A sorting domain-containing protein [Aureispira anguillae]BDS13452.1 T9SS type A sorting domain-containing protein [Aureispira anguillae]